MTSTNQFAVPDEYGTDTHIEKYFAHAIHKHLGGSDDPARIDTQVWCCDKKYRVDFYIWHLEKDRRIVVECDGAAYHNAAKDAIRDAEILKSGFCDAIYRFRGKDLFNADCLCVLFLAKREPDFFSEDGVRRIENIVRGNVTVLDMSEGRNSQHGKYEQWVEIDSQRADRVDEESGEKYVHRDFYATVRNRAHANREAA